MRHISIYPGAIIEVQTTLMQLNSKNIFLVTGKKSFESCGAKEKLGWLLDKHPVTHFNDFQTNPDSNDVIKGVQLFNQGKCDTIVSVGGGSVMDMAKLINYYHNTGLKTIGESNIKNENLNPVTHVSLPTTAGSGSEATHFAVMYIGDTKYSVAHEKLIPNVAIIDPELHYSQTPYQKAVSGVDALAQAIESFWSVQSTEESRLYSEKALELVWNNLPKVVHESDKAAHLKLAVGANLAGRAINIAKTTAPHALAYGFTKYAGLPHGHAVALGLPYFIYMHCQIVKWNNAKYNPPKIKKIMELISAIMGSDISNIHDITNKYLGSIMININFQELNISKSLFRDIIKNVNQERLSNNPIDINYEGLLCLYNYNIQESKLW